jgi:hypothetical protein
MPEVRVVDDAGEHRRHHEGVGDALVLDRGQPARRVELRLQHRRTADVERVEHRRQSGDVVERRAEQ